MRLLGLKKNWLAFVRLLRKARLALILTLALLSTSCKRVQSVVRENQTVKWQERIKTDSVLYRDTAWIERKGDSIFITRNVQSIRWCRDTIRLQDTIRQTQTREKIKVQKKVDWKKTIALGLLGAIGLSCGVALIKKRLKRI